MTGRAQQDGVDGKRSGDTKELADVVDVGDVLTDEDGAWRHGWLVGIDVHRLKRRTLRHREDAAMEIDARDLFEDLVTRAVERCGTVVGVEQFRRARKHARTREH